MIHFEYGYIKNHSEFRSNIFIDSYLHKIDYFRKMSLLREYSSKLLIPIFLSLFLQLLLLFFYYWFYSYVTDILIVIVYFSYNFFFLYVYFLSIHLKRATLLAQEKSRRKKIVQFYQNSIVYWLFTFFSVMRCRATVLCVTCMIFSVHNNFYVKDAWIKKSKSG